MRKLKRPQTVQLTVEGAWDLEFSYRMLLKLNIGAAGNLPTNRWYSNTGFRLTTQTF